MATRTIIVGTAGHIDHGKSSLVRALTGTDPDRLKEEKARGITIELGFAHAQVADDVVASFVDVPGHERFVRAMLAGVGGIDAVVLVVAATESVMPQTREHFDICRLLRVPRGVIALTKCDAADDTAIEFSALEVRELVAGSFLESAPIVQVSARTGAGLDTLRDALADLARHMPPRFRAGPVRLPVDRAFSLRGFGTVLTGTLTSGTVAVEDDLELLPSGVRVKVRGLHVHGRPCETAGAGERVAVNVAGVDVADVPRGAVAAAPGALQATRRADATVTTLPGASIKHGARVRVHQGTAEVLARVSVAGESGIVDAGATADVRLRFETPAILSRGDRIVIRTYSPLITVAGGVVLDPQPPRAGVRTPRGRARMAALAHREPAAEDWPIAAREMVAAAGLQGLTVKALAPRIGAATAELVPVLHALDAAGAVVFAGDWVVDAAAAQAPVPALLAGLADFHRASPLATGLPLEEARGRWFPDVPALVFERVIGRLVTSGTVSARDTLALRSHRVELTSEEAEIFDWLDRRYLEAGFAPPEPAALAAEERRAPALVERIAQLMVKQRRLVRVDTLLFHPATLERLKREVTARKAAAGAASATIDVKAFKESYNVSRKYAIPLLEYLDRERLTRRSGDTRVVI